MCSHSLTAFINENSVLPQPRIYAIFLNIGKALLQKKEELQQAKAEAEEVLHYKAVDMADPRVVRNYVNDMRDLLAKSSITEQRSFLKSFVERIEVGDSEVKMYYTIPMPLHDPPKRH